MRTARRSGTARQTARLAAVFAAPLVAAAPPAHPQQPSPCANAHPLAQLGYAAHAQQPSPCANADALAKLGYAADAKALYKKLAGVQPCADGKLAPAPKEDLLQAARHLRDNGFDDESRKKLQAYVEQGGTVPR